METLLGLVTGYGVAVILAATFLSCLLLPIPSSLIMLTGGAFVASGDLAFWSVVGAAYGGAVLGDQVGYRVGRVAGAPLLDRLGRSPARARMIARARDLIDQRGGLGVFFSTWLVAPLGPWVNLIAGAGGLGALRFTLWDAAGEAIWVGIYVGAGYLFASQIETLAGLAGNISGALAAGVVALGLAAWLRAALRADRDKTPGDEG